MAATDFDKLGQIMALRMELQAAKFEGRADDAQAILARIKTLKEG